MRNSEMLIQASFHSAPDAELYQDVLEHLEQLQPTMQGRAFALFPGGKAGNAQEERNPWLPGFLLPRREMFSSPAG